jgi:hypothetical protein
MQGTQQRERLELYALLPKVKLGELERDLAHNSNMTNWECEIARCGHCHGLPWAELCSPDLQGPLTLRNAMNRNGINTAGIGWMRLKSSMAFHVI